MTPDVELETSQAMDEMVELKVTPRSNRAVTGSLDDAFSLRLIQRLVGTLWVRNIGETDAKADKLQELRAAMTAMAALAPQDEIEGMLAAQAVALNAASMECLRRAMIPEQPAQYQGQMLKHGANLARCFTDMLDALDRKRGKHRNQVVRVERVTVQAGGQAIVGNVAPGAVGGGGRHGTETEGEPHTSPARLARDASAGAIVPTMRSQDAGREYVPVGGDAERAMPDARRRQHRAAHG